MSVFDEIKREFRILRWMLFAQMVLSAATFAALFTAIGARWIP